MKFFLYKQKLLFCQGDGYLWPHCCMNNLYISHRSLYAPTYSFWAIRSMHISLFRVTSWLIPFAILWHAGLNLKKTFAWTWTTIIWLQYLEAFWTQIYVFLVLLTIFHFNLEKFISKTCRYIFFYQKFIHFGRKYF